MRLPNDTQRHNIYGKTGSGKTQAGLWALEKRRFDIRPWIILDFKRDTLIAKIPRVEEIGIKEKLPRHPGLYAVRPLPHETDEVNDFFFTAWTQGDVGIFIDETFMVGRFSKGYDAVCTQGRSLHIPLIQLSQRPAWLPRFTMSEADFHQVFFIQTPADVERLENWVPADVRSLRQDYHSFYYDVSKNAVGMLAPVPPLSEILERFSAKLPRRTPLFRGWFSNADPDTKRKAG